MCSVLVRLKWNEWSDEGDECTIIEGRGKALSFTLPLAFRDCCSVNGSPQKMTRCRRSL